MSKPGRHAPNAASTDVARTTLGLRLALWYSAIFVVSSSLVIALTYLLLSGSLRQRDQEIIRTKLVEYAGAYRGGGLEALNRALQREQAAGTQEPLFLRVISPYQEAIFFRMPADWGSFDLDRLVRRPTGGEADWTIATGRGHEARLEVASIALGDGTLMQVGKSTGARDAILASFRYLLAGALVTVIAVGLMGGALLTRSALQPVRRLAAVVRDIIRTGRLDARVPERPARDALDELTALFNAMLDRMQGLMDGMRGALDNVAHDLRTPMTRLRHTAEVALEEARSAEDYRNALADCLEESERVLTMLTALMDISEAETGALRLQRERLRVDAVLADAADLYADLAEAKDVALEAASSPDLYVWADRVRLRQAVSNLVDNAVKYTPPGGRVRLEARAFDGTIEISVIDTGVGMPAEELGRIWDRLYRGDRSRSERGLGLGLSLVKAIVEAHGGRVAVSSQPGAGSTFSVTLPAVAA